MPPVTDHPRSRGVYVPLRPEAALTLGSSPLARGLRDIPESFPGGVGIIPARAGFTLASTRTAPTRLDHPRSRGVYA